METSFNRRSFLSTSALAPLGLALARRANAEPPPLFTTSINIEIMFPRAMPRSDYVDSEHAMSSTPEHAISVVQALAAATD